MPLSPKVLDWLRECLASLEGIKVSEIKMPEKEVGEKEIVIGALINRELRKFYHLKMLLDEEQERSRIEALHLAIDQKAENHRVNGEHDYGTCPSCSKILQFLMLNKRLSAVDKLFWAAVHAELPEAELMKSLTPTSSGIGLRKGWAIVLLPPKLTSLMELMMGGL